MKFNLIILLFLLKYSCLAQLQDFYLFDYTKIKPEHIIANNVRECRAFHQTVIYGDTTEKYLSTIMEFNKHGLIVKETGYLSPGDTTAAYFIDFFYDGDQNLIKTFWSWTFPPDIYAYEYVYGRGGKLKETREFYLNESNIAKVVKLKYNLFGRLKKTVDLNNVVLTRYKRKRGNIHRYDAYGRFTGCYKKGKPQRVYSDIMMEFTDFNYNEQELLTKAVVTDTLGDTVSVADYRYKANLLATDVTRHLLSREIWINEYRYYSIDGREVAKEVQ